MVGLDSNSNPVVLLRSQASLEVFVFDSNKNLDHRELQCRHPNFGCKFSALLVILLLGSKINAMGSQSNQLGGTVLPNGISPGAYNDRSMSHRIKDFFLFGETHNS
jgi:hypothetical protein